MTIAEVIEMESARQAPETWNVIHLTKEGEWYRAHDWSAWLMSEFPLVENLDKPLKVIAKKLKDGYIDAWLGFPASSISKYIPNDNSITFHPISDTQIDVVIELPASIGDMTFENLNKKKEEWKASIPITENKKQRREDREVAEQAPRITRITDVISRIVSIPIEDMSPREAWETLRDIRRQVTAMF